jgi:hypothetical protein
MTSYNILTSKEAPGAITEIEFYALIIQFQKSYLKDFNYDEGLLITREPLAFRNRVLNELNKLDLEIQNRLEMRHHDQIAQRLGFVPSEIKQIWVVDKRLKSLYNSTIRYCFLNNKDYVRIAVHIAEYRAIVRLENKVKKDIRKYIKTIEDVPYKPFKKPTKRTAIPRIVIVRLQKESNNKCAFCDFNDPGHLEVHHIDEDRTHKDPERLIMVCPTCHSKINSNDITRSDVETRKKELISKIDLNFQKEKKLTLNTTVANISTGNNTTLIVEKSKTRVFKKYPQGCIGYDIKKANYIGKLVERYHQYKEWQVGKERMNYAILNSQLKKQFKIGKQRSIYNIPIEEFENLAKTIQERIDNTKLGRINKKKHPNYLPYSDSTS